MSINISLPPELETRVRQRVESGLYGSASEVIREALRLLEAYEGVRLSRLDALRQDVAEGMKDVKAGRIRVLNLSGLKRRARQELKKRKAG